MKKFAEVKEGLISNIAVFNDDAEIPENWVDVTDKICSKGYPVKNGIVVERPSNNHKLINGEWEEQPEKKVGNKKINIDEKINSCTTIKELKTALIEILN